MREDEDAGDGVTISYISQNGFLETGYMESDTGVSDRFTYSFDMPAAGALEPWIGQQGDQVSYDSDNVEYNRVPFSWKTRGLQKRKIADCNYDVIPLETYYYEPDGNSMVEFLWIPELGIAVTSGFSDFIDRTSYSYLSFKTVTD